jgi:prolyl-tRNA editing enzyme YbaK/EbsC (Cys-tRNA(Pro) deacylase)
VLLSDSYESAKKLAAGAASLAANLVEPSRLVKLNSSHDVGGSSPYGVQWFLSHGDTFAHFEGNVVDTSP